MNYYDPEASKIMSGHDDTDAIGDDSDKQHVDDELVDRIFRNLNL